MSSFTLEAVPSAERIAAVFELHGEVDVTGAPEFERQVDQLLSERPLVVDLSHGRYLDSAGFAALDRLMGRGLVIVVTPTCVLHRAAAMLGLEVCADVASASRNANRRNRHRSDL